MRKFLMGIAIAAFAVAASPAHAQLQDQTWVASNGNNAANCSRATPCADFSTSLFKTNAGGQINCVDSGQYGGAGTLITKAITIDCTGVNAQVTTTGVGIGVAVPGGTKVSLRNLSIPGNASTGIALTTGGIIDIENCVTRADSSVRPRISLRYAHSLSAHSGRQRGDTCASFSWE